MFQSAAIEQPGPTAFAEGMVRNPYPIYEALRDAGPVVWSDEARGGAWLLTRYVDIAAALSDPRLSAARADWFTSSLDEPQRQRLEPLTTALSRWLLLMVAPRHTMLRKALNYGFKPAVIESLRPAVEQLVDELLSPLRSSDPGSCSPRAPAFDFIHDFAYPLPARVIARMLGVPGSDQRQFMVWSDDVVAFMGSLGSSFARGLRAQDALHSMTEYFRELVAQRVAERDEREDLTGLLLAAQRRGEFETDEELLAQCSMFFFAGHETTRNLLGNGLYTLLRHPDQASLLRASPGLMQRGVRELARYESPVQFTGRRALEDLTLHGRTIRRGDKVLLMLGSGNRDPGRFSDPDRLDVTRDEGPPLSFGYGPHVCIGTTLSYLQAGIAFSRVLADLPDIHCLDLTPLWVDNPAFRGLQRLCLAPRSGHLPPAGSTAARMTAPTQHSGPGPGTASVPGRAL